MHFAIYDAGLRATLTDITASARLVLPHLLGAIALLLCGWLLGSLLQRLSTPLTRRFDGFTRRANVDGALSASACSRQQ